MRIRLPMGTISVFVFCLAMPCMAADSLYSCVNRVTKASRIVKDSGECLRTERAVPIGPSQEGGGLLAPPQPPGKSEAKRGSDPESGSRCPQCHD